MAIPRRDNIFEEKWMIILQSLQDEDVEWRAPWMISMKFCTDVETSIESLYSGY
ncbi:hypothetical protein Golax_002449, partial [Gossypium laxum]|nr:hypothetical protein [Gossypium laxum]